MNLLNAAQSSFRSRNNDSNISHNDSSSSATTASASGSGRRASSAPLSASLHERDLPPPSRPRGRPGGIYRGSSQSLGLSGLDCISSTFGSEHSTTTDHHHHQQQQQLNNQASHSSNSSSHNNETDKFVARAEKALKHVHDDDASTVGGTSNSPSVTDASFVSAAHRSSGSMSVLSSQTPTYISSKTSSTTATNVTKKKPISTTTTLQKLHLSKDNEVEFVGREAEVIALSEAVDTLMSSDCKGNVKHSGSTSDSDSCQGKLLPSPSRAPPRVISISGLPGSGKSRLAQRVRSRVMERDGYFVTGKMDQHSTSMRDTSTDSSNKQRASDSGPEEAQAYSGLATAMHQLAEQIIARDFDMGIRRRLQETIVGKEDVKVLVEIFPALATILQNDYDESDIDEPIDGHHPKDEEGEGNINHSNRLRSPQPKRPQAAFRGNRRRFLFQQFIRVLLTPHESYEDEDIEDDFNYKDKASADSANGAHIKELDPIVLVLVLEDLQWIDTPSLELISSLVRDQDIPKFLLITTTRPLEAKQPGHSFLKHIQLWTSESISVDSYHLDNLNSKEINMVLASLLDSSDDLDSTKELSELVHQKTDGNPFFAIEFIKALVDQDLLHYSFGDMRWKYDIQKVQSLALDGDNTAVGLLTSKLKRLSPQKQLVLVVASCLGMTFKEELVGRLVQHLDGEDVMGDPVPDSEEQQPMKPSSNTTELAYFEELGFLGHTREVFFFSHDLIQQAATALVSGNKSLLIKLRIGEYILQTSTKYGASSSKEMLFLGVDLCTDAACRLQWQQPRPMKLKWTKLAHFNLLAGEQAMQESAFALSLRYARAGLGVLDAHCVGGEDVSEVEVNLLACVAEASHCTLNMEYMGAYVNRLLRHPKCPDEIKFRMMHLKIVSKNSLGQLAEAFAVGWDTLVLLGVAKFPKKPSAVYVLKELMKTKRLLRGHTKETLLALPLMKDDNRIMALSIFDAIISTCYISNPNLFIVTQLKSIRWAVKYGVSKYAPSAFGILAMVLLHTMGEVENAILYSKFDVLCLFASGFICVSDLSTLISYNANLLLSKATSLWHFRNSFAIRKPSPKHHQWHFSGSIPGKTTCGVAVHHFYIRTDLPWNLVTQKLE